MKVLCFSLVLHCSAVYSQSYIQKYPEHALFARHHVLSNATQYKKLAKSCQLEVRSLLAIVLPEVAHYNSLSDMAQTKASEVFYVELGSDYGDFSVGIFQMKPSFVEQLENEVGKEPALNKFSSICTFENKKPEEIRLERLDRIQDSWWRFYYICCFYSMCELRFRNIEFQNNEAKIAFYAAAYNCGFQRPAAQIEKISKRKLFPYLGQPGDFAYADVALEFYQVLMDVDF